MEKPKGKKVPELKKATNSNSLEATKSVDGFAKAPGQTGLYGPQSLDAVRKPRPEQRVDKGERIFGGVSEPKRVDQSEDLYAPSPKSKSPKKSE